MPIDSKHFPEHPSEISSVIELISRRASFLGDQTAYIFLADGEKEEIPITYRDLDLQARAAGVMLQQVGIDQDRVLLLYPPGLEYIVAFLGCLYSGMVAIPAYPPRGNRTWPRLQSIIKASQATVALTTASIKSQVDRWHQCLPELKKLTWLTLEGLSGYVGRDLKKTNISSDSLALIQYTSGSTSLPKGVMLSHGNIIHNQYMIHKAFRQTEQSSVVGWLPFYHDMGLIGNIFQPMYMGIPCILMSPLHFLQKPVRWLSAISHYRATTSGGPNFAYDLCVKKTVAKERAQLDLSSWCVAFNGSEPVRKEVLDKFIDAFKPSGFKEQAFYPCYGLAEATLLVSGSKDKGCHPPKALTICKDALKRNQVVKASAQNIPTQTLVGCGRVGLDQQILIVDPRSFTPCENSQVGEIWLKGPNLAKGYWGLPEETQRIFQASLSTEDRGHFLRTGDLGFLLNDELFVTGRLKDLIIIRGRNYYPQDIEWVVGQSHPALRQGSSAAFANEDVKREQLVVVQEIDFRQHPNIDEVVAAIQRAVAQEHEIQVDEIVLIRPGTILKTSSGKIQRRACRAQFLAGDLKIVSRWKGPIASSEDTYIGPRNSVEKKLVQIWADVFETRQVSIYDNFYNLGGDSLLATQIVSKANDIWQTQLSLEKLLERPTIADLANYIYEEGATSIPTFQPTSYKTSSNLSYAQERLWFLHKLNPGSSSYNIPIALRLKGHINVAALSQSIEEIVRRHESMRAVFITSNNGKPVQVISPPEKLTLQYVNICSLTEQIRYTLLRRLIKEESWRPFDLSRKPLFRAMLLHAGESDYVFLFTVHHIVFDGKSLNIFLHEFQALYDAFSNQGVSPLPKLDIQYRDFVSWQRKIVEEGALEGQICYWTSQLSNISKLELPAYNPSQRPEISEGTHHSIVLSRSLTRKVKALCENEGVTPFMVLLAAFKIVLYRITKHKEIVVGSPISGRNSVKLEGVIGFFANTLVLRTHLLENLSFYEILQRVRQVCLEAYANQDIPFTKLVEALQPKRNMDFAPFFNITFSLQHALSNRIKFSNIIVELLEVESGVPMFDLMLDLWEVEGRFQGLLRFDKSVFSPARVGQIARQFDAILCQIVKSPHLTLKMLSTMIDEIERQYENLEEKKLAKTRLERLRNITAKVLHNP